MDNLALLLWDQGCLEEAKQLKDGHYESKNEAT